MNEGGREGEREEQKKEGQLPPMPTVDQPKTGPWSLRGNVDTASGSWALRDL